MATKSKSKAYKFLRVQLCTLLNLKKDEFFEDNIRKIAIEFVRFFNIIVENEKIIDELIIEFKQIYNEKAYFTKIKP